MWCGAEFTEDNILNYNGLYCALFCRIAPRLAKLGASQLFNILFVSITNYNLLIIIFYLKVIGLVRHRVRART